MTDDPHQGLGPPLLTVRAAAEWCDVSEKSIQRAIRSGKLKALKIGNQRRIRPEDLLAYAERDD